MCYVLHATNTQKVRRHATSAAILGGVWLSIGGGGGGGGGGGVEGAVAVAAVAAAA
jgi:hypothetical protein